MNTIFLLLLLFLIVAWIIFSVKSLLEMLKRQKRLAALRMNPQEIPLHPDQPPDLAPLPGVLTRKFSGKGMWFLFGIGSGIAILIAIVILVIVFTIVALIVPAPFPDILLLGAILLSSLSLCWVVLCLIVVLLLYQRIEANEIGLTVQRGLIRRQIAWDQALVFAVDHKIDDRRRERASNWDELSGESQVVRWEYDAEISPAIFLQFTPPEYQQALKRLRSYIHQKTGLPLRDLRSFRK